MGRYARKAVVPAVVIFLLAVTIPLQYLVRREVVVGIPSESTHSHAGHEEEGEHAETESSEEEGEHAIEHVEGEGHLAGEVPLGTNLIPNYGFEVGTREQIWGWASYGSEQGETIYRDGAVAHRGLASAAISTNGATIDGAVWYMRLDELPLDHDVLVEGYIKTEGLAGAAYLKITLETGEEAAGDRQVFTWAYSDTVAGDNDWTFRSVSIYVPTKTTGVWLEVGLNGQGKAWFDDLNCVASEPE